MEERQTRPSYYDFIRALDNQLNEYGLTSSEQLLYHTLLMINNRKHWVDWFYCTDVYLTDFMKIGVTAMKNARNILKQCGMIDFIPSKKRGESTKYRVCDEFCSNVCTYSINVQTNNKRSTNTLQTNNKPDANKDKRQKIEDVRCNNPLTPFSGDVGKKVEEWLRYKSERGQKYKPTGLKTLFKNISANLDTYGEQAVIRVIDASMSNNWQGLFFDKLNQQKPADKGGNPFLDMLDDDEFMDGGDVF